MNLTMSSNSLTVLFCMLLPALHLSLGYKPEIQAFPSKVVKKGNSATIRCSYPYYQGGFRLQRTENSSWFIDEITKKNEHNFTVTNVQEPASYYCTQSNSNGWSENSDSLELQVIDPQKPIISCQQRDKTFLVTCISLDPPKECNVKRFYLYDGKSRLRDLNPRGISLNVTFKVSNLTAEHTCSYELEVKEDSHLIESPKSYVVTATKCIGEKVKKISTDNEGETENKEENYSNDHGTKGTKGIDNGVLIPVVAGACGILIMILVVILVFYLIKKKKRSPQNIKKNELPHSEEAEANTEETYCTVDESKLRVTPNVQVDMNDTTVDDDNEEGITYARLNKVTLKQKNEQSDIPTDTSLYAVVKKSQPL